ncbi:vWA domain-containing protein [Desulfotignum balticum]|uniref:vWA domain-containing protein n=1 Tax=Desulfotignum balticum TaxID=115781 RepID=UPI00146DB54A|nr:vWA domain-containing protein [Desulfotignum balticum]
MGCLICFCFASTAVAAPTIFTLVLDASGSIEEKDFNTMNRAAGNFIDLIYEASQLPINIGERADFLSVAWFGGNDQYMQTPYINGSNESQLSVLTQQMRQLQHPNHGHTALYTALAKATIASVEHDGNLPGFYNNVIILITDGKDTQSPNDVKQVIRNIYPNNRIFVAIIGVGQQATPTYLNNEFGGIADDIRHLGNFDELAAVLILYSALAR